MLHGLCPHAHHFIASGRGEAARVVAEDGVGRKDMGFREFREITCDKKTSWLGDESKHQIRDLGRARMLKEFSLPPRSRSRGYQ